MGEQEKKFLKNVLASNNLSLERKTQAMKEYKQMEKLEEFEKNFNKTKRINIPKSSAKHSRINIPKSSAKHIFSFVKRIKM